LGADVAGPSYFVTALEPSGKAIILRGQKLKFNWPFLYCQGSTIFLKIVSLCSKSEAMLAAMQPQLKSLKNVKSFFYVLYFTVP
jgi:hypothetical protein